MIPHLPPELTEEIASYLSFKDVINCSKANLQWEEAFNLERIWKRFTTSDKKCFENQLSKLNYTTNSQLEPCPSKALVLKELFVKENFLAGKFHVEEIDIGPSYCDCIKETIDKTGNHWLFISLANGTEFKSQHSIQVWNLNACPKLHICSETPLGLIPTRPLDSRMKLFGDRLFYILDNLILIYEFAHPQYELKFLNKIQLSLLRFPANTFLRVKMVCLPDMIVGFAYTSFHIHQRLSPSYEIWAHDGTSVCDNFDQVDIHNRIPTNFPQISVKKNDESKITVIYEFYVAEEDQSHFSIKVFDSKKLEFTDFFVQKPGTVKSFDVSKNNVIVLYRTASDRHSFAETFVEGYNIENKICFFANLFRDDVPLKLSNNGDIIAIGKFLIVFGVSDTGLSHIKSFEVPSKDCRIYTFKNNCTIIACDGKDTFYEMYNYKTGTKMYSIKLPRQGLSFSFKKAYSFPTDLIAYSKPGLLYAKQVCHSSIFIITFW